MILFARLFLSRHGVTASSSKAFQRELGSLQLRLPNPHDILKRLKFSRGPGMLREFASYPGIERRCGLVFGEEALFFVIW